MLLAGIICEGPTDERFLFGLLPRVLFDICADLKRPLELYDPVRLKAKNTNGFVDVCLDALAQGLEIGCNLVVIQSDADAITNYNVMMYKVIPLFNRIQADDILTPEIVFAIPIQMIEAWMLADLNCLLAEIGGQTQNHGLNHQAQNFADPKNEIKKVIYQAHARRFSRQRRNQVQIPDLYDPIGQKSDLTLLRHLPSFKQFEDDLRQAIFAAGYR